MPNVWDGTNVLLEILRVVKPPVLAVTTPPKTPVGMTGQSVPNSGRPYNALDDDVRLASVRPRLNITVTEFPPDRLPACRHCLRNPEYWSRSCKQGTRVLARTSYRCTRWPDSL